MAMTARSRRRWIETLRWVGALSTLVAVVLFFRAPLGYSVLPGFDRVLANTGVDRAFQLGAAPGFQIRAESEPPGGRMYIDGEYVSTLPMLSNVICRTGQNVELEVRLDGYRPWTRTVTCREAGQLEVTARLEK